MQREEWLQGAWRKIACGLAAASAALGGVLAPAAQPSAWAVLAPPLAPDSVVADGAPDASARALEALALRGYGLAQVDSLRRGTVHATPGPRLVVDAVELVGPTLFDARLVQASWATRAGTPYRASVLAADLGALLDRYASRGRLDARAVPRLVMTAADSVVRVQLRVDVDEGAVATSAGVELVGAARSSRRFASRVGALRPGAPLDPYEPDRLRARLEATGLYAEVGVPVLARERDGRLVARVPVRDAPPGAFDLVLGYLPPSAGRAGSVVGTGRLELRNPFGGGRTAELAFVRNPGLVSRLDVAARDPFVAGLPVALGVAFAGEARDSTFSRRQGRLALGWTLAPGLSVSATGAAETVSPGRFGAEVVSGAPRVRASTAAFAGTGLRYEAVDRPRLPRRGLVLDVLVESGIRRRAATTDSLLSDSTRAQAASPRQQRLLASARAYVPLTARLGLAAGVDARVLVSGRGAGGEGTPGYDEGELFRYGGAQSLRGYDEEAFVGNAVGRLLGEGRLWLDADAYALVFCDLGYVATPALPGRRAARAVRPGYGVGAVLATGLGPVTVTYALNPDLPAARGKVHVGLRVGL